MAALRLEKLLRKKQLSKRQFARMIGMDSKNIHRIFRPTYNPRLRDLERYAQALGCKVRDLIEG